MNKKEAEISDKKLISFLLLAAFISVISVWTIIISLDFNVLEGRTQTTIIQQGPPPQPTSGTVGLLILPNQENEELIKKLHEQNEAQNATDE